MYKLYIKRLLSEYTIEKVLNIVNISFCDNHHKLILVAISFISIYFGIKTITSKNPIVSILFLIGLFFFISLYLIYIGLGFIGLSYLLVYIGAISILFLFILMLINIRTSELLTDNYNSIPLAIITIVLFNESLNNVLAKDQSIQLISYLEKMPQLFTNMFLNLPMNDFFKIYMTQNINYYTSVTSKVWDSLLVQLTHISSVGNILYTNHYINFVLVSLILLLAMVGCIKITINNNTN